MGHQERGFVVDSVDLIEVFFRTFEEWLEGHNPATTPSPINTNLPNQKKVGRVKD